LDYKYLLLMERLQPLPSYKELKLNVSQLLTISEQLLNALSIMHDQYDIIHRDIKYDNLMLVPRANENDALQLKLIDFGLAVHFSHYQEKGRQMTSTGTTPFMAPEFGKSIMNS